MVKSALRTQYFDAFDEYLATKQLLALVALSLLKFYFAECEFNTKARRLWSADNRSPQNVASALDGFLQCIALIQEVCAVPKDGMRIKFGR